MFTRDPLVDFVGLLLLKCRTIELWEALTLVVLYFVYLLIVTFSPAIRQCWRIKVQGKAMKKRISFVAAKNGLLDDDEDDELLGVDEDVEDSPYDDGLASNKPKSNRKVAINEDVEGDDEDEDDEDDEEAAPWLVRALTLPAPCAPARACGAPLRFGLVVVSVCTPRLTRLTASPVQSSWQTVAGYPLQIMFKYTIPVCEEGTKYVPALLNQPAHPAVNDHAPNTFPVCLLLLLLPLPFL